MEPVPRRLLPVALGEAGTLCCSCKGFAAAIARSPLVTVTGVLKDQSRCGASQRPCRNLEPQPRLCSRHAAARGLTAELLFSAARSPVAGLWHPARRVSPGFSAPALGLSRAAFRRSMSRYLETAFSSVNIFFRDLEQSTIETAVFRQKKMQGQYSYGSCFGLWRCPSGCPVVSLRIASGCAPMVSRRVSRGAALGDCLRVSRGGSMGAIGKKQGKAEGRAT